MGVGLLKFGSLGSSSPGYGVGSIRLVGRGYAVGVGYGVGAGRRVKVGYMVNVGNGVEVIVYGVGSGRLVGRGYAVGVGRNVGVGYGVGVTPGGFDGLSGRYGLYAVYVGYGVGEGRGVGVGSTGLGPGSGNGVGVGYGVGCVPSSRKVGVGRSVGVGNNVCVGRMVYVGYGVGIGRLSGGRITIGSGWTGAGSGSLAAAHPSANNFIAPVVPSSVRIKFGISTPPESRACCVSRMLYALPQSSVVNRFRNAGLVGSQLT